MKHGLTDTQWSLVFKEFEKFSEIKRVILFGSRAMGNFKPGSDVDLFVVGNDKLTSKMVTRLFGVLNNEVSLPFHFDVLFDDTNVSMEIRKHIDEFGIEIFSRKE